MTTSSASSVNNDFSRHPLSDAAISRIEVLSKALNEADKNSDRQGVRVAALEALKARGFPSRKDEDWQYTPLNNLLKVDFVQRVPAELDVGVIESLLPPFEACKLVFVDGVFQASSSDGQLPDGLCIEPLSKADAAQLKTWQQLAAVERDAFELLNLALLNEGLQIKAASTVDKPVLLLHIHTQADQLANVRHLIRVEKGAHLTVVEQHVALDDVPGLSNVVVETDVAEDADFRHLKLQQQSLSAFHMAHHFVRQQANSNFASFYAALGAEVSRHFTHTCLLGENANMNVNSAGLATGAQVMDSRTFTEHASACCTSRQLHKLVVDDEARGVFDGMIHVARGAQKTDGLMDNKNLLLGPKSKVDAKPRLEIYADDVKCSHGSATGRLDQNQLFYLQARGVDAGAARLLITTAFLTEPMEALANESMRQWLQQALASKLNRS
jgi:Fe-S cluster assembly protein SufD